jgi:NTP pyrophosphatase (non-canonical NTP hydrolase)
MQNDRTTTIQDLKTALAEFVQNRDWQKFHSPKNLAMSISIEAAELMELFQWLTVEESLIALKNKHTKKMAEKEIADILLYILEFCNTTGIDLARATFAKLEENSKKYPVLVCRGKPHKYTRYRPKNKGTA